MEQAVQAKTEQQPTKIRVGRALMMIGCILFFINAAAQLFVFILMLVGKFVPGDAFVEVKKEFDVMWADPISAIKYLLSPFIAIFLIVSGIGGISWLRDKGPFISAAPLMAMICLALMVINFFTDVRALVTSNWNWVQFIFNILDIQLTGGIYFIGWALAKNQID